MSEEINKTLSKKVQMTYDDMEFYRLICKKRQPVKKKLTNTQKSTRKKFGQSYNRDN